MRTRFVEATQDADAGLNHGKFMVALFDADEWECRCELDAYYAERVGVLAPARPLLRRCGWTREHVLVVDLQTGEGAIFRAGGNARADLDKHKVWVCPMFEPFLEWLYGAARGEAWLEALPALVELPHAAPATQGYRRGG
jgi:hypothetical protein